MQGQEVVFSQNAKGAESQLWATDRNTIKKLEARYGKITLDIAATERSRVCPNYLGPDHPSMPRRNALAVGWQVFNPELGPMWLNPPYDQKGIFNWFDRVNCEMFACSNIRTTYPGPVVDITLLMLLPSRTSNQWFHQHVMNNSWCHEVLFGEGRLTFLEDATMEPVKDKKGRPTCAPFPSMVLVYKNRPRPVAGAPIMGSF